MERPRGQLTPARGLAALAGVLLLVGYGWLVHAAVVRLGVRATAVGLLALAALSFVADLRHAAGFRSPAGRHGLAVLRIPAVIVLGAAATLGDARLLYLVPALIQLALCVSFAEGARAPVSTVEQMAQRMEPLLPDWVGPYCRKATWAWAGFFALNAAILAGLAWLGPVEAWRFHASVGVWLWAGVFQLCETVVRKVHFRAFDDNVVDRQWRRVFPPENTANGRRSLAYIAGMQAKLDRVADRTELDALPKLEGER